jgi:hypothetical protein
MKYKKPISKPSNIIIGGIYPQGKHGDLKVTGYNGCQKVTVVFVATGYTRKAATQKILNGNVKDPFAPSVHGVGFFGVGSYTAFTTSNKKSTKQYKTWICMLERCYSKKLHDKHPTYIGCSVHADWHNYQVFAKWFDENYIDGFQLDKDIKIDGNKIYSPSTCLFVCAKDNMIKASAGTSELIDPNGVKVSIYNMMEFCKKNNLNRNLMRRVVTGKAIQHKGWTKVPDL